MAGAQNNLGFNLVMKQHRAGKIDEAELREGMEWLQTAADQENANALMALGGLYAGGVAVPQDRLKARALAVRARRQGAARAPERLRQIDRLEREAGAAAGR